MKSKIMFMAILVAGLTFVSIESYAQTDKKTTAPMQKTKYTCPHHPDYMSDKPGKCSCGMELVAAKEKDKMKEDKNKMKDEGMKQESGEMKMENDSTTLKKDEM